MGLANFEKIPVTSVTGVKTQSISMITNMEIQFMNSVKIIESNLYISIDLFTDTAAILN